jgi:hypothetical protein
MDIEWQGQGICTLYDDDGLARASACILLLHSAYLVVARDWGLQEQEQEGDGKEDRNRV